MRNHPRKEFFTSNTQANEPVILRSCYLNSLLLATKLGAKSISFPLIASGTYGFPKDKVLLIASKAISDFLYANDSDLKVVLCVFDREAYELSQAIELDTFIRDHQDPTVFASKCCDYIAFPAGEETIGSVPANSEQSTSSDLDLWLKNHDDTFAVTLMKLIDKKKMTDVQCYKKANVSRKTFSKINNDPNYRPSKATALAFAIALELTLSETEQLLRTVGFSLSHSDKFDLIIEFYISNGIYDIFEINAALYKYDQVTLVRLAKWVRLCE